MVGHRALVSAVNGKVEMVAAAKGVVAEAASAAAMAMAAMLLAVQVFAAGALA